MTRLPLVVGNWKMNGRQALARNLASEIGEYCPDPVQVVVCPPFPYLTAVADRLAGGAMLGAQDLCGHEDGAFTGEVSAEMLVDVGCRFVIVGHSERRQLYGERDDQVVAKFRRAQAAGLTPILCVGETLEERLAGQTEQVVVGQLDAVLKAAGVLALKTAVLAYEPVWAIGSGRTASPEQAQQVHAMLRATVSAQDPETAAGLRLLYGGSVKADNAAPLFAQPDIDGGLIGGASLHTRQFMAVCQAAG